MPFQSVSSPPNRTILELKSHKRCYKKWGGSPPNRTILELKFCKAFPEPVKGIAPNRTILELKYWSGFNITARKDPQSYHTGIEIGQGPYHHHPWGVPQSYHTGIEIAIPRERTVSLSPPNRTILELKWHTGPQHVGVEHNPQSYHTGIEICCRR